MTSEQISKLLLLLERIADKPFTITQASDWPIIAFSIGLIAALVGLMWRDLGNKFTEHKKDNVREHDKIWSALRDCHEDCCGIKKSPDK